MIEKDSGFGHGFKKKEKNKINKNKQKFTNEIHILSRLFLLEFFDWLDYTLYSAIKDWEYIYKYIVNSIQLGGGERGKEGSTFARST